MGTFDDLPEWYKKSFIFSDKFLKQAGSHPVYAAIVGDWFARQLMGWSWQIVEARVQPQMIALGGKEMTPDFLIRSLTGEYATFDMNSYPLGAVGQEIFRPDAYGSWLLQQTLKPSLDYSETANVHVVFVTAKRTRFHVESPVVEISSYAQKATNAPGYTNSKSTRAALNKNGVIPVERKLHIYLIDGSYRGENRVGTALGDLFSDNPDVIHDKRLRIVVDSLRKTGAEAERMVEELEQLWTAEQLATLNDASLALAKMGKIEERANKVEERANKVEERANKVEEENASLKSLIREITSRGAQGLDPKALALLRNVTNGLPN